MRKYLFISLILLPGLGSTQTLTLEAAIAAALQNNYSIRLSKNDSLLQDMQLGYANAAFMPRLNAGFGQTFSNNDQQQKFSNGAIRERDNIRADNINANLALNWTLFDGMKMFISRTRLENNYELSLLQLHRQISLTISSVIKTYYGIIREKQALKATREQMALNEERVKLAEGKLQSGLGAKPELLQAKLDLNAQQSSGKIQQAAIDKLKEDLNQLMAAEAGQAFEVTDSIPLKEDLDINNILEEASSSNPDILISGKQIRIAELGLKEIKADQLPIIAFNGNYNFLRNNNRAVVNDFTPLFNKNSGFNFGFTAAIPLFNQFANKREIKSSMIEIDRQKLSKDLQSYQNRIAIRKAFREYLVQRELLKLEEENISLARENVYIAAERFRMGITNSLELREAQKSLEEAYNRLIAARYAAKLAETDLLQIQGSLIKKQ